MSSDISYFIFSKNQIAQIENFFIANKNAALVLDVEKNLERVQEENQSSKNKTEVHDVAKDESFLYGFLFSSDIENGKLKTLSEKLDAVSFDMISFSHLLLSLSLDDGALTLGDTVLKINGITSEKENPKNFPIGFFVKKTESVKINSITLSPCVLGWKQNDDKAFFGFSSCGGSAKIPTSAVFDFSEGQNIFSLSKDSVKKASKITISFDGFENFYGFEEGSFPTFTLDVGGQKFNAFFSHQKSEYEFNTRALKNPFSLCKVNGVNLPRVSSILMSQENVKQNPEANKILSPIKTDLGLALMWNQENWRTSSYELFEWDMFANVLLFDIQNYDIQNNFFRRLAFFVEKAGYRGRLLSDSFLKDKHAYNAHDYKASSLAEFFSLAQKENFPLNDEEELLKEILLFNGIIVQTENGFAEGEGAIISISRSSNDSLRKRLLSHEGWHGIYFTDEKFRNLTSSVFYTMDETSREFLLGYWSSQPSLNYDVTDEDLVQNEFMAYLMQQPVSSVANYFVTRSSWQSVVSKIPQLAEHVRNTNGRAFEDASLIFDSYAKDNWDLSCGRIWLVF